MLSVITQPTMNLNKANLVWYTFVGLTMYLLVLAGPPGIIFFQGVRLAGDGNHKPIFHLAIYDFHSSLPLIFFQGRTMQYVGMDRI